MKPLGDDWLFWDPECIHQYPDGKRSELAAAKTEEPAADPVPEGYRKNSALVLAGTGFAVAVTLALGVMLLIWMSFDATLAGTGKAVGQGPEGNSQSPAINMPVGGVVSHAQCR